MSSTTVPGTPWGGYGAGAVLSVAAHLGAGALVWALVQPQPFTDQPAPKSELRIETEAVTQSEAKPEVATGEKAAAAAASGASLSQGTIAQSTARAAALPQTSARQAAPPAPVAAQSAADVAKVQPAEVPAAEPVVSAQAPAQKLTAQSVTEQTVTAQTLTSLAALAPVQATESLPTDQPLAAAVVEAPQVAALATLGQAVAPDATPGTSLAAAPATGQAMTATLAWSSAGGTVDPVSLKAIAAFMKPGDAAAESDEVHDGLAALLAGVPCSRLQAEFNPDTGALALRGHVPDPALKAPLLAALQTQLGSGIKVEDAMVILPRPQCGALAGIADVGLPQSQDQFTNPRLVGPDAQARTFGYVNGQSMVLDLAAPDYDAYVYVDFFDAAGDVIHLVPNETVPLTLRPAKSAMHVGAPDGDAPYLKITVGPPYGQEIAAAFAASAPLYEGTRPVSEPAGPYLDWLKTKVAEARARDPGFKGEWVYFMVSTTEK